jgi:hypothetical protein
MKLASNKLASRNRMNTEVKGGKPETAFSIPKKLLPQQRYKTARPTPRLDFLVVVDILN